MTSSIKWEPIEDIKAINDTVRSFCARSWGRVPLPRWLGIRPPMDVAETGEAFVAKVDLPGVQASDVEVSVSASQVTIKGTRSLAAVEDEGAVQALKNVRENAPLGRSRSTLSLPDGVDGERITARLEQGVLTLTMPKHTAPPVEIEIEPAPESTEE